ncbi:hypothetical protein ACLOJK_015730 [Asimina triloba]
MMSEVEKASSSSQRAQEIDPLLRDLTERNQSIRRNIVSLAAEVKDVRSKLASSEESLARETLTRQVAESKAKCMEEELCRLQKSLEERNGQLQASTSTAQEVGFFDLPFIFYSGTFVANDSNPWHEFVFIRAGFGIFCVLAMDPWKGTREKVPCAMRALKPYLKELDGLRSQLSITKATAGDSAASAHSAQLLCETLLRELDEKNSSLQEQEDRVTRLRDEIRVMSAHWKLKTKELEAQLEKHRRADRELKKRVVKLESCLQEAQELKERVVKLESCIQEAPELKERVVKLESCLQEAQELKERVKLECCLQEGQELKERVKLESCLQEAQELKERVVKLESCLQEARSQMRLLQKMGERRDRALKELQEQLAMKQESVGCGPPVDKQNFWESSRFKFVVSMSMLVLVIVAKR